VKRAALRWSDLLPRLGAGACLGVIEVLLVAAGQLTLFLSAKEFTRAAGIMVAVAISLVATLASACHLVVAGLRRVAPQRLTLGVAVVTALFATPPAAWLFWELSEGRRVRSHQLRPVVVCVAALLAAGLAITLTLELLRVARLPRARRLPMFMVLSCFVAVALACDGLVLRRLYPAFHLGLDGIAVACAAAMTVAWPWRAPLRARLAYAWIVIGLVCGAAAPFWLRATRDAPNLHYALQQASPLAGKLLGLFPRRPAARLNPQTPRALRHGVAPQAGIVLRGDDVLLITVDALRADRLQAYGARVALTPTLDKLAEQSVLFTRAYTQTPHTSYALGSLFTGKYLRPVLSLPGVTEAHATLPRLLRRYGYRTAAFYPPAVFFVDQERFAGLAQDHFGFEYVKEMFAPADQRVPQLQAYLEQVDKGHPLFVWVHLFEPHEPYDPPPAFARGDEPEQRYNAEVAAADAAIAQLIAVFRAHKPAATVIVTADHGEEFGDHGGYHHGTTLFDEQIRVPLLWSSPGRAQPRRISAPVQLIDLAPTLLAALGIPRDARMRGADLSAILAGAVPAPQLRAFASTDELRMWTDGLHKLVCDANQAACRLYDLQRDPAETRDDSVEQRVVFDRLSRELSELVASIPDVEAISLHGSEGWPKALARARLGDASVAPLLPALLGDERNAVRAEAVRAVAVLKVQVALPVVTTLAEQDADPVVRDEAALAGFVLGAADFSARVQQALLEARTNEAQGLDFARRAAFALLPGEPEPAADIIADLAADSGASKLDREHALNALCEAHANDLTPRVITLLDDVRLRPAVARALGQLGGAAAASALRAALAQERYPEARGAEAAALVALHEPAANSLIVHMLGTETGLPNGLSLWAASGGSRGPHGRLLDLRAGKRANSMRGTWSCTPASAQSAGGCTPVDRATLSVTRLPKGEWRAVLEVSAPGAGAWLQMANQTLALRTGKNELAFPLANPVPAAGWALHASPGVRISLLAFVPRVADIPPPAPEPQPGAASDNPDLTPHP
jgi:arylsulfatase A-like enzyme